jgi:hypothetical protein
MKQRRAATIGRIKGMTAQEHSIRLSEHVKDVDANPRSERTALGVWSTGKGGTSSTAYDTPPVLIPSKRKYRGG